MECVRCTSSTTRFARLLKNILNAAAVLADYLPVASFFSCVGEPVLSNVLRSLKHIILDDRHQCYRPTLLSTFSKLVQTESQHNMLHVAD